MNIMTYIFNSNVINFLIVFAFVVWLIKKVKLGEMIEKKCSEIAESIKNAEDEKKFKQNHLDATKIKVANVQQEITKIIDEGKQVANSLSFSIKKDTEEKSEDLHKKAVASLETEKQVISSEIMTQVANAAFYIAEEHIKQAIDDRLHRKYIDEFIENIPKQEI